MTASPQMLDVNTGLPVGSGAYPRNQVSAGSDVTSNSGNVVTENTRGTTQSSQSQTAAQSTLNTTPQALQALHSLITQLTDRPAISEDSLNQKAPLVALQYSPNGWMNYDPLTGRYVTAQEAQQINTQRTAQRAQMSKDAGVIQGGTAEQIQMQGERRTEISRARTQQGAYSKEAAMGDAQALMNKAIADALRTAMPQITMASEGAGTSKSTFRAQATQEAAVRGGVEGAALGANLSVSYGQIFNQLEGVLEQLTRTDPNGPSAMLLQALNVAKGIANTGVTSTATSGTQQSQGTATKQVGGSSEIKTSQGVVERDQGTMGGLPNPNASVVPIPTQTPVNPYYAFSAGTNSLDSGVQAPSTFNADAAYAATVRETALNYED